MVLFSLVRRYDLKHIGELIILQRSTLDHTPVGNSTGD